MQGNIESNTAHVANLTVAGSATVKQLHVESVKTPFLEVDHLMTTRISSPTGTIIIDGNLMLTHGIKHSSDSSFLQTQERLVDNTPGNI